MNKQDQINLIREKCIAANPKIARRSLSTRMSRRFDRTLKVNQQVRDILEDPNTLRYLGGKLIRRRPKWMPRFVWKCFLFVVMAPGTRSK